MIELGARVQLRPDLAKQRTIGCQGKPKQVDWRKRKGTVVSIGKPCNALGQGIGIQWDDRRTPDYWPAKALVQISGPPPSMSD